MNRLELPALLLGRTLLGLYFIFPGLMKVVGFDGTAAYMALHNVPLVPVALGLTILLQLGGGAAVIVGWQARWAALMLAALTLVISIYMHNFWDYPEGMERGHELQNFIKNLGILAGLLVLAGRGAGPMSLDARAGRAS